MLNSAEPRYQVESVVRACKILSAFESEQDRPRLQDLAERTGLNRSTALRLLRTLESCGFVERTSLQRYRCLINKPKGKLWRVGYAVDSLGKRFRREVSDGLEQTATEYDVELLVFDNVGDRRNAVRVASAVIQSGADLVIDFQTGYEMGQVVAAKYLEAGIPMIAVDTPHPGATFFGVNNYIAGRDGGRWLANWVRDHWDGRADAIALIESDVEGVISSRVRGALAGLQDRLGVAGSPRVIELSSKASFEPSFRAMQSLMSKVRRGRILVVAPTDPGVMGVLTALEEVGSSVEAAVLGFGGNLETRGALRAPRSRLVGCVGFFPEKYGRPLLTTALRIIEGKSVPPAVFIEHQILTKDNVDLLYPNDQATIAAAKLTI